MKPLYGLLSVLGSMPDPIRFWIVFSTACVMTTIDHYRVFARRRPGATMPAASPTLGTAPP